MSFAPHAPARQATLPVVRPVFQPVVDLVDGGVVAHEALARGGPGQPEQSAADLFGWAARHGRTTELDHSSQVAALRGALAAGLPPGSGLFLNVEPASLSGPEPSELLPLVEAVRAAGLHVVLEITERALARDPSGLLAAAERIRARGWALAIDDVGAEPASLALMPFLTPQVIKLDLRLIQSRTTVDVARIVNAVNAQAERTGAVVLAEGIETEAHRELALAMGAHLGQGWLLGRPGPLALRPDLRPFVPARSGLVPAPPADVPWDLVRDRPSVRRARKPLLAAMSRHLERQGLAGDREATVVLGAFQRAGYFTPATAARYESLAATAFMVAAYGEGLPADPARGVRGQSLAADDPLVEEWTVVVVSPHFAAALIAHDVGSGAGVPEAERQFDYVVSYERDVALGAAACLLRRLTPVAATVPRPR